jgi:hypothetical protein
MFTLGRAVMVASFALFALSACGGDNGPSGGVPGTYTLRTYNGDVLPYTDYDDGTFKSEVIAETLVLKSDNTFTVTTRYRDTETGTAPSVYDDGPYSGTWAKDGSTITFSIEGTDIPATLSGNSITITDPDDNVSVYKKG